MQKGTASAVRKLEDIGGHFVSVPGVPCWLNFNRSEVGPCLTKSRGTGSMEAAGNTTRVVYVCSVCDKAFGDIHSSCAKHVNGRGACKAKGAVVLQLPINFSRNDRNVGGRLGLQHGFGRLAAPGQAGHSDMEGGRPPSPAQAPLSGTHTYPIYLSLCILKTYPNLSQLSYILIPTILYILSFIPLIRYIPM
jgi:hypothetical protein